MSKYLYILFLFISVNLSAQEIEWVAIDNAQELQKANPEKSLFIDVYTDWCGWCKKMDNTTFKDKEVVSFLNDYFIPVKFNAEQKEEVIFNNQKFNFMQVGRRGVHELAAALLQGSLSYPSYVVMNSDGNITHIFKGYMSPNDLLNGF